ncbi:MAG: alpha/beta hydrolase, partial [Candidatus Moranbacteria bacterium]|nr:alpha/beta hydrolase [Candidatus Moranbacteria bacterium]
PDPVIVIPGIMGSATKYPGGIGKLEIDPILHTYDNLIATLKKNGYKEDENLFLFPYEWRDSNIQSAQKLKEKIDEIKKQTGRPKVDLVAHSMGGLVARHYIEGGNYEGDVDQLITLGTPHKGAPKAYLKWEAGEGFFSATDKLSKIFFEMEAHHNGFGSIKDYIQTRILSVKELLPNYSYLQEASGGATKNYPDNYPQNTFLEFLNSLNRLNNMKNVDFTNIIGNTKENDTIEKYKVIKSDKEGIWEHGMPENYYDNTTDRGIVHGRGDETVPLSSAEGIASDNKIILDSSHGDLPTSAECEVFRELTGNQKCSEMNIFDKITDILTFSVFSPIDIQIESPSGERIGKNFDTGDELNEIEGAFYTGYNTENEFITIPNPEDGEYRILTEGTGSGEYTIEIVKIVDSASGADSTEDTEIEIIGTAEPDVQEEVKVEIDGGQVKKVEKQMLSETEDQKESDAEKEPAEDISEKNHPDLPSIQKTDILKGKVRQFFNNRKIRSRKKVKKISQKLSHIRINLKRYSLEKNLKKMKKYQSKINTRIGKLKRFISKDSPRVIDADAAESLIADLEDLKTD